MAKRGGFPGGMPGNMTNLMKQAQRMQRQMEEKTKELEYFYPTAVLVTGYDIIFFWVIRMERRRLFP